MLSDYSLPFSAWLRSSQKITWGSALLWNPRRWLPLFPTSFFDSTQTIAGPTLLWSFMASMLTCLLDSLRWPADPHNSHKNNINHLGRLAICAPATTECSIWFASSLFWNSLCFAILRPHNQIQNMLLLFPDSSSVLSFYLLLALFAALLAEPSLLINCPKRPTQRKNK